jgi:hypothetical protein
MFDLTWHAQERMQQRGIRTDLVALILENGESTHAAGAVFYHVGHKDVPDHLPAALKERLEGGTVVMDPATGEILTVYRNRTANRHIRRKPRFDRPKRPTTVNDQRRPS